MRHDSGRARDDEDNGYDDLINLVVYLLVGGIAVLAFAGWLDSQFGWGLKDWLLGMLNSLVSGGE